MSVFPHEKPILEVTPIFEDEERTVVRVALNGVNRRMINHGSTTTYRVIYGRGMMEVDGSPIELTEGVEVTVPISTPYKDAGRLVMEATSEPPFDPEKIEYLE